MMQEEGKGRERESEEEETEQTAFAAQSFALLCCAGAGLNGAGLWWRRLRYSLSCVHESSAFDGVTGGSRSGRVSRRVEFLCGSGRVV